MDSTLAEERGVLPGVRVDVQVSHLASLNTWGMPIVFAGWVWELELPVWSPLIPSSHSGSRVSDDKDPLYPLGTSEAGRGTTHGCLLGGGSPRSAHGLH